jgi:hypothetical protein
MDNFDLKSYLSNNPLLTEIKVISPGIFSDKDLEALNILADESYGDGISEIERDSPMTETYDLEEYEHDPEEDDNDNINQKHMALKHLLNKFNGIYVLYDLFESSFEAPGAPSKAFYTRVTIDRNNQSISVCSFCPIK